MDARQLTYFLGIVDHGGFGKAAEALHVAQPSLSQAMRQLESELGVQLFHRVGRGVILSEPGSQLVGPARQVLRDLRTAREAVTSTKELERGAVDIVTMPSPGIEPLTTLISRLGERHPGMTTNAAGVFTPEEVVAAVSSGASEIGLLGAAGRPHTADLQVIPLGAQALVLISPPGSAPEGTSVISRDELSGLDLVVSQRGSLMRQLVDDVLASGSQVRIVAEVAHRTSLLPLVLARVGHAVMPDSWTTIAESTGCVVRRIDPSSHLDVALVHRARGLTPGAAAFVELAREYASVAAEDVMVDAAPRR